MKLTIGSWLREWLRAARVAFVCLVGAAALGQAPSTTTVTGTVYLANGQPGSGTLVLNWPTFTTAAGQLVVADSTTVTIPTDGFVSVNLVANQGSTPAGEYYTARFYMSDGSTQTQYWVVPAAASATLAAVQSQVMPAAQAVQAVSKAYVDEAIAELAGSQITSSGGSLTGPLYLNGDPTAPLQAADKHYVDTELSQALPLSGGTLAGPLTVGGALLGASSVRFSGLAAASGANCLQVDNAGNVTNTGAACGAGGGSGSGTVNSGTTNQVAVYSASGTAVGGSNSLSLPGTISGAGVNDTNRPWVDTFTVPAPGATCGSGTDEFAKLCQLDVNAQGTYTGSIERSTGVSGTTVTGSVNPFAPYLTAIPFVGTPVDSIKRLAPGTLYTAPSEVDIPTGGEIDGQSTYLFNGSPVTGTWITAASNFSFAPTSSVAGNVLVNMGNSSSTSSATFSLVNKLHNIGVDCGTTPWSTGVEEGQSQQGMEIYALSVRDCTYGLSVDNLGNGDGGAQNHGDIYRNNFVLGAPSTLGVTSVVVTAGGSYSQAPAVTISGCTPNPNAVASLTGTAVTSVTIVNASGNGYGLLCPPGSTTVSFATTFGSGAAATAVLSASPPPVGIAMGRAHTSGGGLYFSNGVVGSGTAISRGTGVTLDNSNEILLNQYVESAETALCAGCHTSGSITGNMILGLRVQGSNEPIQNALQLGLSASTAKLGQLSVFDIAGSTLRNWVNDANPDGGICRNDIWNGLGVPAYIRGTDMVFSMCHGIATTGLVLSNSFYNCGSCTVANQPRQYLPGKLVGGYVQSMSLGDTAQSVGIGTNGNFDTSNAHKSDFAHAGLVPIQLDPSVTVNVGDLVGVSTNTVVTGQSIAGGVDMSTATFPVSGYTGWLFGTIAAFSGTDGATSIPSAPSTGSVTVTPSASGSVTYSYQFTASTGKDKTESAPSSTVTTSTGPASLVAMAHNTIAGLATGDYNVYRTALGSSTLPTLTAAMCGTQLCSISGWTGATGYTWAPTAGFSGGSCTVEPTVTLYVSGGAPAGWYISNAGNCTGTPTITLTKSTCETGWIGSISSSTSFIDYGWCGDGSTPPASGILAPLVALNLQYNGTPGTGNVNGPGSSINNDLSSYNGITGQVIKDSGVAAASLTANTAPLWLQYLGTGADGAYTCTSGTCAAIAGEKYYSSFNVSSGAVQLMNSFLVAHVTGACTINGTIIGNGAETGLATSGIGGAGSGGSGGGTAAGTAGTATYLSVTLSGNTAGSAGAAGAASGGNGGNGGGPTTSVQRTILGNGIGLDGFLLQGAPGHAGGSSGGVAGAPGGGVVLICGSITGTGTIDVSGSNGGAVAANSTGGGSGGGGGVVILSSQAAETFGIAIDTGGGAGGQASVPYAAPVGTSSVATGNQGTIPPILTLGVTSGALSSCTVTNAGSGLGASPSINFGVLGGGGTGGTIMPTYSGGAVASCTASGGSGYTASTFTTAGNGGYGGAGWSAEFSGW